MIIDKGEVTLKKILEFCELENKRVLEIGCGNGRITRGLADRPKSLTAIDPDPDSLAAAKKEIAGVNFQVGSGESLEFADDSFDIVLFTLSLHHQNSCQALAEAARVLKEGGQALVVEPAADSELMILCNIYHDETEVLNKAMRAVDESSLGIDCREFFITSWEFAGADEFHAWMFDFYQCPNDSTKVDRVNALLGSQLHNRPLVISDKYVISGLSS